MEAFNVDVQTPQEAHKILQVLADYDLFQYENKVKPDYASVGRLNVFEDGEWCSWYDEDGDSIDEWAEKQTIITHIALDLEGTLISNAMSQIARPGLYNFLQTCAQRAAVVIYTTVRESVFRRIAHTLVEHKEAPVWFKDIDYIYGNGKTKDLSCVADNVDAIKVLLFDDYEQYVHEGQEQQWIPVKEFCSPYSQDDTELLTIWGRVDRQFSKVQ